MYRLGLVAAVLMTAATIAGCGADAQDEDVVQMRELYSATHPNTGITTHKSAQVIVDADTYERLVPRYTSEEVITVDFSSSRVLLVDMGERPTGGYAVEVTSIEGRGDSVVAQVTLARPAEGCPVTEAISNPYQLVEINTTAEILVQEQLVTSPCN